MNSPSTAHPFRSFRRTLFAALATLGLIIGLTASFAGASTQAPSLDSQFFNVIGGGNAQFLMVPDAQLHTPEGDYAGLSGLRAFGNDLGDSFSNITFATKSVDQAGSLMVVSFTLNGINTGSYHGLAATCTGISVPGVVVLQTNEAGFVVEQWIGYDADAISSQIASFNQFDPNTRPGCADHNILPQDEAPVAAPTYQPAPSCPNNMKCSLPY
jgi:hypothetical protein